MLKAARGFTLVELVVTMTVAALLLAEAVPWFADAVANARARAVVNQFLQDFAWARGQAASGAATVTVTITGSNAGGCTWNTSQALLGSNSSAESVPGHSSAANVLAGCSGFASPLTFTFTSQGFVSPSSAIVFTGSTGQTWPVQVLGSGSVLLSAGAS